MQRGATTLPCTAKPTVTATPNPEPAQPHRHKLGQNKQATLVGRAVPSPRQVVSEQHQSEEAWQSSISPPDLTSKPTHTPLWLRLLGTGFTGDSRSKGRKSRRMTPFAARGSAGHAPPSRPLTLHFSQYNYLAERHSAHPWGACKRMLSHSLSPCEMPHGVLLPLLVRHRESGELKCAAALLPCHL